MEEKIPFGYPIENEQQRKNITEGFKAESKRKKEEETEKNKKEIKDILSKGKTRGKDRKRIKDLLEDL
ncbi:MAG: hypothetical protein NTY80_04470 [candidate division SR1 bacterium]|nr:hypothetical protein [candidate division SR1 bacterium]